MALEKIEYHAEKETEQLIRLFAPAIEDADRISQVDVRMEAYIKDRFFNVLSQKDIRAIYHPISKALDGAKEFRKYEKGLEAAQKIAALKIYGKLSEKATEGMGFSLITNDFISAASYLAVDAHNTKKSLKQAEAFLDAALDGIHHDGSIPKHHVLATFHAIGVSARIAELAIQAKDFRMAHADFYGNKGLYDLGEQIGTGYHVYDILANSINAGNYIASFPSCKEELAAKGYIHMLDGGNACITSTKFEQSVIQELAFRANPEARMLAAQNEADERGQACSQAEQHLKNGEYFEAAKCYCQAGTYQDAMAKSVQLWHNQILKGGFLVNHRYCVMAVTESGEICFDGSYPGSLTDSMDIRKANFKKTVANWGNVAQIADTEGLVALKADGTVGNAHDRDIYNIKDHTCVPGNGTGWKDIKHIEQQGSHMVGLHFNGTVSAVGINDHGECNVSGWKDMVKVCPCSDATVGLRRDGTVLWTAPDSWYDCDSLRSWDNIVDIAASGKMIAGLRADGTVVVLGKTRQIQTELQQVASWKEVVKIKAYPSSPKGALLVGFTRSGKPLVFNTGRGYEIQHFLRNQENVVDADCDTLYQQCVVLHADGTVSSLNCNFDLSSWHDIVFLSFSSGKENSCCGVRSNGTVVYEGNREDVNVQAIQKWKLFSDINKTANTEEKMKQWNRQRQTEAQKKLDAARKELGELKGLFTGSKRKQLTAEIAQLESEIKTLVQRIGLLNG